jgi:hypothetical protein
LVLEKGFGRWQGYRVVLGGIVLGLAIAGRLLSPFGGKQRAAMRYFL